MPFDVVFVQAAFELFGCRVDRTANRTTATSVDRSHEQGVPPSTEHSSSI